MNYEQGDEVRIDIPDETDRDHPFHGSVGVIKSVIEDDAGEVTGREADSDVYRIQLDSGEIVDVRRRDLRPPF